MLELADLDEMLEDDLPKELMVDPTHPSNDAFYESQRQITAAISLQTARLRPIEVQATKLHFTGLPQTKIAERLDVGAMSVGKYLKKPDARRLLALLSHLQQLNDGATLAHRKHILYRIAIDNEGHRPNVSVQAIQEINKISGAYEPAQASNVFNIQINSELLPRGQLDTLPKPHIIEGEIDG